jgi:hypothetical protein
LPTSSGDAFRVVGLDGRVVPLRSTSGTPPSIGRFDGQEYALDMCANVTRHTLHYHVQYQLGLSPDCRADSLTHLTLVTPAENVREVRTTRQMMPGARWIAGLSLFFGLTLPSLVGGTYLIAKLPNRPLAFGIGVPLIAFGGALGAFKLQVLFTPDTQAVVYP